MALEPTLGLGFDWYAISLLVLWIYADTPTPLRLPQIAAAAVHLLYRKPVLASFVLGTSIYLYIDGLRIGLSFVHIEVLTFFALGAVYAHILYTHHLVRFINALLSATVIGTILHSASMFEPFSDLGYEVPAISVAISLPGVQEMMSSLFGLFSGVLFHRAFEGYQKDERHAQVALVAGMFILCYICGFKIYILREAIDVSLLFHVSYFSVLLFVFVVGARWGLIGVITTSCLALILFIGVMLFKFSLFLLCSADQIDYSTCRLSADSIQDTILWIT